MRANEIIRSILDLIDGVDSGAQQPTVKIAIGSTPIESDPIAMVAEPESSEEFAGDDVRRFKQIVDLASADTDGSSSPFSNAPNEKVADIDAVTVDAGGGMQAPKHPSDIRVQHPSMYPGHQHKAGE
jgi:hypothetical protein